MFDIHGEILVREDSAKTAGGIQVHKNSSSERECKKIYLLFRSLMK